MAHIRRLLFIAGIAQLAMSCSVSHGESNSDHFDGTHFFNAEDAAGTSAETLVEKPKWRWSIKPAEWPEWIEDKKWPPPIKDVALGELEGRQGNGRKTAESDLTL